MTKPWIVLVSLATLAGATQALAAGTNSTATALPSSPATALPSDPMTPAAARSEATPAPSAERHYLLDPVELTPVLGFTAINGTAGFNLGALGAYPLLKDAPLFVEPSLVLGIFSGDTMFNFTGAARYDVVLAGTKIRPFARAGFGPTFQTSGSAAVFNATFGGGIFYPISRSLELRAEASLVDIDGNAGLQLTTGLSL